MSERISEPFQYSEKVKVFQWEKREKNGEAEWRTGVGRWPPTSPLCFEIFFPPFVTKTKICFSVLCFFLFSPLWLECGAGGGWRSSWILAWCGSTKKSFGDGIMDSIHFKAAPIEAKKLFCRESGARGQNGVVQLLPSPVTLLQNLFFASFYCPRPPILLQTRSASPVLNSHPNDLYKISPSNWCLTCLLAVHGMRLELHCCSGGICPDAELKKRSEACKFVAFFGFHEKFEIFCHFQWNFAISRQSWSKFCDFLLISNFFKNFWLKFPNFLLFWSKTCKS